VFLSLLVNGFFQGVPIAIAALGFAVIWYTAKEFHFLYGTMLAASGYLLYSLASNGVPLLVAALATMAVAAAVGAVIEHFFYRRLGDPLSVLLFSFGLAIVVQNVLQIVYGPQEIVLPSTGSLSSRSVTVVPFTAETRQLRDVVALGALVIVWGLVTWMVNRTDTGLAMEAVMKDPEASQYIGVRPARIKWIAYAIGSAIGALAGVMSMISSGVNPNTGFSVMLYAFMATFLAAGKLVHVPLWGMGIGIFLSLVAWKLPTNFNTLVTFAVMLLYVLLAQRINANRAQRRDARTQRKLAEVRS
jgi:branched-chain amino acid transport system permease protein